MSPPSSQITDTEAARCAQYIGLLAAYRTMLKSFAEKGGTQYELHQNTLKGETDDFSAAVVDLQSENVWADFAVVANQISPTDKDADKTDLPLLLPHAISSENAAALWRLQGGGAGGRDERGRILTPPMPFLICEFLGTTTACSERPSTSYVSSGTTVPLPMSSQERVVDLDGMFMGFQLQQGPSCGCNGIHHDTHRPKRELLALCTVAGSPGELIWR